MQYQRKQYFKPDRLPSSVSHLLQTEDEGLGTENLVGLSGFTKSFLDDVAIIIIVLRQRKKTIKNMQEDKV